jgi:spermidine synthase
MGFRSLDIAEIAPGIVEGARHYFRHINGSVLKAANVRLILEDGRNSLLLRPKRYDLITIEISSVWFAGATNLFSREFYTLVRNRLKPGGVFQQWLQLHHIGRAEIETVLVSLRSQFPEVSFWVVGGQGLLVASQAPQRIQTTFFERLTSNVSRIGWPPMESAARLRALVASRILAPDDVSQLAAQGQAVQNTDRNRRLEYFTPRYNHVVTDLKSQNVRGLASIARFPPIELAPDASGALAEACRGIGRSEYLHNLGIRSGMKAASGSGPSAP